MTLETSKASNGWQLRAQRVAQLKQLKPGARVHVAGVCGTGTSAVALLLKEQGFFVSGSDKAFYPPMDAIVRKHCDRLYEEFSAAHITADLDLVVIGNALGASNPEVQQTLALGLQYCSMPDVFEAFLIGSRDFCPTSVVVAGTHGKTTTTALTSWLFESAGRLPGYFLGGIPENFSTHIRPVSTTIPLEKRVVVLEGDEYDSAYFAKWPKFHSYRPDIFLVTSLEFDHADIYQSVDDIRMQFREALLGMADGAVALFWTGAQQLQLLAKELRELGFKNKIYFYGATNEADFKLVSRNVLPEVGQQLTLNLQGQHCEFQIPASGEHNALNALAAAAIGQLSGLSAEQMGQAFKSFSGVKRRQQQLFKSDKLLLLEDFAHHPTAVKTTLQGLKEQYPNRRLVAVFEPRSNTSRRNFFQQSYADSFAPADVAILQAVADANVYSAFGENSEVLRVDIIVDEIAKTGKEAFLCDDADAILKLLQLVMQFGDVVVLMSNGAFGGLPAKLKSWVETHSFA